MKISDIIRKGLKLRYCGAVIVAAGTASRMGGVDKMFAPLQDKPVLRYSLEAFQNAIAVKEIVVVTRPDLLEQVRLQCVSFDKVQAVVAGGATRQESVEKGIAALSKKVKLVAVHDGARPLISQAVIDRTVRAANSYNAAAPAIPVKDTIKVADGGLVVSTPERSRLWAVQTPQVFDKDILSAALVKAKQDDAAVTDDCSAVERMGVKVKLVEGEEQNLKITTPMDLKVAQMLMEEA